MIAHPLSRTEVPANKRARILVFRGDHKIWEIRRWCDFEHWVGDPELAYTHWAYLPKAPEQDKVSFLYD